MDSRASLTPEPSESTFDTPPDSPGIANAFKLQLDSASMRRSHTLPLECTSRLAWRASLDVDLPGPSAESREGSCPNLLFSRQPVRKTGIVCTIGPATSTPSTLLALRRAGMNIARLNMSHGDHHTHQNIVEMLRKSEADDGMAASGFRPIAIALDTKGPEIRLSKKIAGNAQYVCVTVGELWIVGLGEEIKNNFLAIDYEGLGETVSTGSKIYIDDGNLQLSVLSLIDANSVEVKALNSHKVKPGKAVNLPYAKVRLPPVSEKDREDLKFAAALGLDMVFASFVRRASDILFIRSVLDSCMPCDEIDGHRRCFTQPKDIKIIAKIENHEGVQSIDEILQVADGIMVARGDLGVELPPEKVFVAQKMLIARAGILGKPVICATQMLESMTGNPRPTRAEATDVANAVLDGADCVMLSAETASGMYPVEAVTLMSAICLQAEAVIAYQPLFEEIRQLQLLKDCDMSETIACSAVNATLHAPNAIGAIIVLTTSGHSAFLVAKYRPRVPIIVVTRSAPTARTLHLHRGCYPFIYRSQKRPEVEEEEKEQAEERDGWQRDVDKRFYWAMSRAIDQGLLVHGDRVVCIQGSKGGIGHTNTMRILLVP